MSIASGIVVYVMMWWVVFFMTLPVGVRVSDERQAGHASSAPDRPRLLLKALAATVISAVLWLAYAWALWVGLIEI